MGRVFFAGGYIGKPSRLPKGYTELVSVQSTGTQFIDTGLYANQNFAVKVRFSTKQRTNGGIVLAMDGWSKPNGFGIFVNAAKFGTSNMEKEGVWSDGSVHTMELTSNGQLYLDGVLQWTGTKVTFTTPRTLTICKSHCAGEVDEYTTMTLYSCQIYDNGTLVRDFVPCISNTDGVGLFDLVNNQFYGNAGTGSFVGSEVS